MNALQTKLRLYFTYKVLTTQPRPTDLYTASFTLSLYSPNLLVQSFHICWQPIGLT